MTGYTPRRAQQPGHAENGMTSLELQVQRYLVIGMTMCRNQGVNPTKTVEFAQCLLSEMV